MRDSWCLKQLKCNARTRSAWTYPQQGQEHSKFQHNKVAPAISQSEDRHTNAVKWPWVWNGMIWFRKNCKTSAVFCDQTRSCSPDALSFSQEQRYKVEEPHNASVAVYQINGGWVRFAGWEAGVPVGWPAHRVSKMKDRQTKAFLTAIRRPILPAIAPTQAATF